MREGGAQIIVSIYKFCPRSRSRVSALWHISATRNGCSYGVHRFIITRNVCMVGITQQKFAISELGSLWNKFFGV